MKKAIFSIVLLAVLSLYSFAAKAQGTITGVVVDAETNEALIGANVVVEGTTKGTIADIDGNFSLPVESGEVNLIITYIGYTNEKVIVSVSNGQTRDLGTIALNSDAIGINEVMVLASVAISRETPVAVSNIPAEMIQTKLGTQEFPEILKSTPGVYATKSGGGFGDGRVNLRGFNSENVAVMINGVPVNDMENGRVYWSNWAGLSDVTRTMQVQRGLGASKVAVPSIGGTINIVTKTTDMEQGGNFISGFGNDGYKKFAGTLSTGLMENGFAATASFASISGNGYIDGTEFKGHNYFVNVSKKIGENHRISFTSFGAPQRHGQRQNRSLISAYREAESDRKYNPDWGIMNGKVTHVEDNFYHKSQNSFNHYWSITPNTTLSTSVYASWGTGGGGGRGGESSLFNQRLGDFDQPMDLDAIVDANRANGANGAISWLRASHNDHSWYGALSSLNTKLTDNLTFVGGIDLRTYTGHHFYEVTDLMGGEYALSDDDINEPNKALKVGDKYNYYNDGVVGWQGLFGQLEYSNDVLSGFVSASVSNTSYKRIDYFNYLDSDPLQETDRYNFVGFMLKGGANYNINQNHNVFANIGYFEKAAGFDAVFLNYDNEHINEDAENQKIFSVELGYGYRTKNFNANINVYRTAWNDRTFTDVLYGPDGEEFFLNLLGVNALHQGLEVDVKWDLATNLSLTGMLSLGDWKWNNNVENVQVYDDQQNPIGDPINLYIDGLKVSDAAQTTAALGIEYQLLSKSYITVDYFYFADYYADFEPTNVTSEGAPQPWKAPDYGTFDVGLRHGFKIGEFDATLIGSMNNVFDTEYIADAINGSGNNAETALVWYGFGRTFSASLKIDF
ncbi:TonB-dependent receptor [Draconibacterium halophilum]|uniref:TonB-dependent receptor n=1 Tax=Draconibacterium halophilum TaxID=2706887 RepID=A0A6C0R8X5_9BACT|nr:TonB-dependent receptor [Draconibacterium halophilum]QIA06382.1 TonB-dependent receptor [Draconibacterium halophilum]